MCLQSVNAKSAKEEACIVFGATCSSETALVYGYLTDLQASKQHFLGSVYT